MKLKIITNPQGSAQDTRIVNAETGEELEGVLDLTVSITGGEERASATLRLYEVILEVNDKG